MKAVPYDDLNRRLFRPAGLTLQHKPGESTIRVIPSTTTD